MLETLLVVLRLSEPIKTNPNSKSQFPIHSTRHSESLRLNYSVGAGVPFSGDRGNLSIQSRGPNNPRL